MKSDEEKLRELVKFINTKPFIEELNEKITQLFMKE